MITKKILKKLYYQEKYGVGEIARKLKISRYRVGFWLGLYKRRPKTDNFKCENSLKSEVNKYNNYILKDASQEELKNPFKLAKGLRKRFYKQYGVMPDKQDG